MKYEEPGTYQLHYKAVDECGNETTQTRQIEVEEAPKERIVLLQDEAISRNSGGTKLLLSTTAEDGDIIYIIVDYGNDEKYVDSYIISNQEIQNGATPTFVVQNPQFSIRFYNGNYQAISFMNRLPDVQGSRAFTLSIEMERSI